VAETGCHILYYAIMDNHYHLLIEMQEIPLDKVMQRINTRYAIYYGKNIESADPSLVVITLLAKSMTKSILFL